MDRALARAVRAIADDHRSGASELAVRATRAIGAWPFNIDFIKGLFK